MKTFIRRRWLAIAFLCVTGCAAAYAAQGYLATTQYGVRLLPVAGNAKPDNCKSGTVCVYASPGPTPAPIFWDGVTANGQKFCTDTNGACAAGSFAIGSTVSGASNSQPLAVNGSGKLAQGVAVTVTAAETFAPSTAIIGSIGGTCVSITDCSGSPIACTGGHCEYPATIASAATAARTFTLPDATDTACGLAATQTLTNKTIDCGSNTCTNFPAGTVANVYAAGASSSDSKIALDSTRAGLIVVDNSTPLTTPLYDVTDHSGFNHYLFVWGTGTATFGPEFGSQGSWNYGAVEHSGMFLANTTVATGSVEQYGPWIEQEGKTWSGGSSQNARWDFGPRSTTGSPSRLCYAWESSIGAGSRTDRMSVCDDGSLNVTTVGTDATHQNALGAVNGDAFTYNGLSQTLTNKTLTAPVINGATSASGNFDLSGSSGTFKTPTGAGTYGGSSNTFTNAVTAKAYAGGGSAPTFSSFNANAGTGASSTSVTGTDTAFEIAFSSGTGAAAGDWVTYSFNHTWASTPFCLISGSNAAAAGNGTASGYSMYYDRAASSATQAIFGFGTALSSSSTAYKFIVHCFQ